MRSAIALVCALAIVVAVNHAVARKEHLLEHGERVYLELAPVDPRSLVQGDYMALQFTVANTVREALVKPGALEVPPNRDGRIVVALDERSVATYRRIDDGTPLAPGERYLRYRLRRGEVKLATNAFFFEEGTGERFEAARYGEFRVAADGELLLAALRGKALEPL